MQCREARVTWADDGAGVAANQGLFELFKGLVDVAATRGDNSQYIGRQQRGFGLGIDMSHDPGHDLVGLCHIASKPERRGHTDLAAQVLWCQCQGALVMRQCARAVTACHGQNTSRPSQGHAAWGDVVHGIEFGLSVGEPTLVDAKIDHVHARVDVLRVELARQQELTLRGFDLITKTQMATIG